MDTYWASVPVEEIGREVIDKDETFRKYTDKTGLLGELRKSYDTFMGMTNIKSIDQSLKAIHINHYANFIRHIHVMVTSSRPAWETRAINTDAESQAATQLGSGLLDYYMREKRLDRVLSRAVEQSLFLREGFVAMGWNVTGGEIYGQNPESGDPIYEGDIDFQNYHCLDVARDITKQDINHKWYVLRRQENKFDLAAKYPDLAEKIIALNLNKKDFMQYGLAPMRFHQDDDSDLIPIYELRHDKTDSMPDGRLSVVLSDDVVLFDGPLPYKNKYVFMMTSAESYGTAFGHSPAMDLLPIQDAFNMTVSAILTNQAANAVQNFQVPKGGAPKVTTIQDGMNIWEYDPKAGKIESMDLLKTAPEVFKFADFLNSQSELISGVNQIARGNAPATLSGAAMALIQQQAIQFSSGTQSSYISLSEQVGSAVLEMLQTYAVVPRVAMIAGKSKRSFVKTYKSEDLKGISRVVVDSANPMTKTAAGKMEIANNLLSTPNMIKTPEQYIAVLTTGNVEPLYEHENGQLMLIRSENEWLIDGKIPQVVITEDDALHVLEHSTVLNSPEAKENPQVVQAVTQHIQLHINQAKSKDPALANMLKQASFAAPPPGPQDLSGIPKTMDSQNPITEQADKVSLPKPAQPPVIQPQV